MKYLAPELIDEMRKATAGLPLYNGGPAVDYTHAMEACALNVTVLYDPQMPNNGRGRYVPQTKTKALIVTRGSGDGVRGSRSGVSGYIDTLHDPSEENPKPDHLFGPVEHTAFQELGTEVGFSRNVLENLQLYAGKSFQAKRRNGGILHVVPLVAIAATSRLPEVKPDGHEVTAFAWVPLGEMSKERRNVCK
jgi:hypothetical protein